MLRSFVPSLKFNASAKKLKATVGIIYSKTENRIGIPSFGNNPGKLFLGVSIHPNRKLWKP
jgi:hypothetical protein